MVLIAVAIATSSTIAGCGDSGKDAALKRGEVAAGDVHRQRLAATQADR